MHLKTAIEGLFYGDLDNAKDLLAIVLREAEGSPKLEEPLLKQIQDACDRIATALENTGQFKQGQALREQYSKLSARYL